MLLFVCVAVYCFVIVMSIVYCVSYEFYFIVLCFMCIIICVCLTRAPGPALQSIGAPTRSHRLRSLILFPLVSAAVSLVPLGEPILLQTELFKIAQVCTELLVPAKLLRFMQQAHLQIPVRAAPRFNPCAERSHFCIGADVCKKEYQHVKLPGAFERVMLEL